MKNCGQPTIRSPDGNPRSRPSPDALQIRPAGGARPQVIRLQPAPHSRTKVLSHSLKVEPANHFVNLQQDPYGNFLARFVFPEPVMRAEDRGRPRRRHDGLQPVRLLRGAGGGEFSVRLPRRHSRRSRRSTGRRSRPGRCSPRSSAASTVRTRNTVNFIVALNAQVQREIGYIIRMETGVQTPEETLAAAKGSCRDSSWLLVQALRNLGIAARFVSGYLIQLKPRPGGARRAARHRGRLHRPARLVRGLSARRRLDRARPDVGPADRREPRAACRDAAFPQRRADLAAWRASPMSTSPSTCASTASPSIRASPSRSRTRAGQALDALGGEVDAALKADDVQARPWAASRPSCRSTISRATRMEHRGGRADQAREGRRADPPAARALRAERLPPLRPGQVVSGRNAAALDVLALLADATASRSGPIPS